MPPAQVADLRALAKAATPGPWAKGLTVVGVRTEYGFQRHIAESLWPNDAQGEADLAYIAAAHPQAVLALLDDRDAATARLAEVEREKSEAVRMGAEGLARYRERAESAEQQAVELEVKLLAAEEDLQEAESRLAAQAERIAALEARIDAHSARYNCTEARHDMD